MSRSVMLERMKLEFEFHKRAADSKRRLVKFLEQHPAVTEFDQLQLDETEKLQQFMARAMTVLNAVSDDDNASATVQ